MPLTAADIITALQADPAYQAMTPAEQGEKLAALLGGPVPVEASSNGAAPPDEVIEGEVVEDDGYAELGEFLDDRLRLSVKRVHYDLPAADIDTGLYCQTLMGVSAGRTPSAKVKQRLDDAEEADLFQRLLGGQQWLVEPEEPNQDDPRAELDPGHPGVPNPRYDPRTDIWARLKAEGHSWPFVQHMGTTAMIWAAMGKEIALEFWKSGGVGPKAAGPKQPQDRLPGTATTTKKPATGTSGPRKRATRKATGRKTS
jgi:hypothetical protein